MHPIIAIKPTVCDDIINGFDFWLGNWEVRQCVWREGKWLELWPTTLTSKNLDGYVLVEEWSGIVLPSEDVAEALPMDATCVRAYDAKTSTWHLHWIDPSNRRFLADFVGKMRDGMGVFFSFGESLVQKLTLSNVGEYALRWEFAVCGERGWETVWVMEVRRMDAGYKTPSNATFVAAKASPSASTHSSM